MPKSPYLKALLFFIYAYAFIVGYLYVKQRDVMYYPMGNERPDISKAKYMEVISVTTQDEVELEAWYRAPKEPNKSTFVMFHGNGGNIEFRPYKVRKFLEEGYGVLLAEYRGYGGNSGEPSETGFYNDGSAYMNWLIEDKSTPSDNVILYGESIGTGVAVEMATRYQVKAVILEVPMSSIAEVARFHYPFIPMMNLLIKDKYDSVSKIGQITAPILIGVGEKDEIIPPQFGKKLFEVANKPKTLKNYPQADHNALHSHGFAEDMMAFVEGLQVSSK